VLGAPCMVLYDWVCCITYVCFLCGAAGYFRNHAPARSLWIMAASVTVDFFATVIPNSGCKSLAINIGASLEIIAAITLGAFVWLLFLGAVFVRLMGKPTLFFVFISSIKILWFVDLVLFFHGVVRFQP